MDRGLTEIHMHIIPNVDDGAASCEVALEMLKFAYDQGIRRIVATPHSFAFEAYKDEVISGYEGLKAMIADNGSGIELMLGTEIYVDRDELKSVIGYLKKGIYPTLNGTGYILTEYSREDGFLDILYCVNRLMDEGYIPIIAHAEKTSLSLSEINALRETGCLIQANYADIIPREGYIVTLRAAQMLKKQLIDLLSTDAHNMTYRKPLTQDALEYIRRTCSPDYVDTLLYKNPAQIAS